MTTQANLQDLTPLANLFEQYRIFYRKEPNLSAATQFMEARLQQQDSVIFLAWSDSQAVGFVQLYPIFSSTRMRRLWLLNDLFVAPDFRGQGYSLQLIDRAKELARTTAACGLMLETETSNTIGNHLYPRAGFVQNKNNFYEWSVEI